MRERLTSPEAALAQQLSKPFILLKGEVFTVS